MGRLQFANSIDNNYNNDNNNYYLSSYTIFIIHSSVNIVPVLFITKQGRYVTFTATRFPYFSSIYPIKVYTWHIKITRTIYIGNDSSCSCSNRYDSGSTNGSCSNSNSHSNNTSSGSGSDNDIIIYNYFIR